MNENEIGVGLYAINNKSLPGLDNFYGQPFLAKDDTTAFEYVKDALKDKLDLINPANFDLVRLGTYNGAASYPIVDRGYSAWNIQFIVQGNLVADGLEIFSEEEIRSE